MEPSHLKESASKSDADRPLAGDRQKALPPLSAWATFSLPFRFLGGQSFVAIIVVNMMVSFMSGLLSATIVGLPFGLVLLAVMFAVHVRYAACTYAVAVGLEDEIIVFRAPEQSLLQSWLLPGFSLMLVYASVSSVVVRLTNALVPDDTTLRGIVAYLGFGLLLIPLPAALHLCMKRPFGMLAVVSQLRIIRAAGVAWLFPYFVALAAFLAPLPVVSFVSPAEYPRALDIVHALGFYVCAWLYGATGASLGWLARRNPEVLRLLQS